MQNVHKISVLFFLYCKFRYICFTTDLAIKFIKLLSRSLPSKSDSFGFGCSQIPRLRTAPAPKPCCKVLVSIYILFQYSLPSLLGVTKWRIGTFPVSVNSYAEVFRDTKVKDVAKINVLFLTMSQEFMLSLFIIALHQ